MPNAVFVIGLNGKPLMPTSSRKARLLLREGKAHVIRMNPFTILITRPALPPSRFLSESIRERAI